MTAEKGETMKHAVQTRLSKLLGLLVELLDKPGEKISDVAAQYPKFHGVYAISDEEDSGVIYVGKSKPGTEGIGQCLRDHLRGGGDSDLGTWLGGDRGRAGRCLVRFIEAPDYIDRRNLEALAIAVLSPKYNK